MKFETPQINLYVEDVYVSKGFYEKLGFKLKFTAEMGGKPVHYEFLLDGFTLGVASKKSARDVHGMRPGKNSGCGIVLWTDDTADSAIQFLLENGATLVSEPIDFLDGQLRSGIVEDPDGNPIEVVCKRAQN